MPGQQTALHRGHCGLPPGRRSASVHRRNQYVGRATSSAAKASEQPPAAVVLQPSPIAPGLPRRRLRATVPAARTGAGAWPAVPTPGQPQPPPPLPAGLLCNGAQPPTTTTTRAARPRESGLWNQILLTAAQTPTHFGQALWWAGSRPPLPALLQKAAEHQHQEPQRNWCGTDSG